MRALVDSASVNGAQHGAAGSTPPLYSVQPTRRHRAGDRAGPSTMTRSAPLRGRAPTDERERAAARRSTLDDARAQDPSPLRACRVANEAWMRSLRGIQRRLID
jgi:hypothetical protein